MCTLLPCKRVDIVRGLREAVERRVGLVWFVIGSRAGPERPYRLCYMRFRPIGMHGRGGACRRSSFTGRDSTAHPCHVALQLHAPLNCRGTLAVKGGTSAECDGVLRPVPRYGWRWGLRVGWGSSGSSSLARASTCLALRRLSSGLPRALVARVTPLVSAADGPLNGGRPDHNRFALRPPTVSPFQIDRSVLWASPLVAASCLIIRSFALSSGFPIWRNFHRGIRSSFRR